MSCTMWTFAILFLSLVAISFAEEKKEYDCFWGDDMKHDGGGEWNITVNCQKGDWQISKATRGDPLTVTMKWRDGSKDFKFCASPSNSFHQPWTVIAKQGSENKNVAINQEMKYYTYEKPSQLAKRFKPANCATSSDKELTVTIEPDDNYWSLRFSYVIYPL